MLDIAICEDDRYQQGELEEKLYAMGKRLGICLEVYVYERGESLLAEIQRGTQYDMVYLDVELGGMSGISLAEELRKKDRTLQIVYVTQYEGYIKKSIDTMPSGYIVKPIKEDELEAVFRRVSSWILGKDDYYRFVSDKIPCKVLLKDILYFKSNLRQAEIVCESQNYVIYKKLDQIELELAETYKRQFLRIHQSYIVNYNFVSRFGHNWVELNTGHCLPMSRKRREDIENKLGIGQIEDYILKQQDKEDIDNYTLAATFVNKVFQPPSRRWTLKRILLMVVPVILIAGGIGIGLYLRYRSIREKEISLESCMESGETYLRYDNYQKAAEEYGEAKRLANSLNREAEAEEAEQYKRLAEEIILADEAMGAEEYQKAQKLYLAARGLSVEAGNVGKEYIEDQLKRTEDYIEVFDLIALGEQKEGYGNLVGAVRAYKEAKEKAASIYYGDGKAEALERQMKAEEKLEKIEMEEAAKQKEREAEIAAEVAKQQAESEASQELENQQKANDQENAIELENKGNELMAQGQYENAITFYQTAQAIYRRLELSVLADGIDGKIAAARAGMSAAASAGEAVPEE